MQHSGIAVAEWSPTLSELQKYIDNADKRFAADRSVERVKAHRPLPLPALDQGEEPHAPAVTRVLEEGA